MYQENERPHDKFLCPFGLVSACPTTMLAFVFQCTCFFPQWHCFLYSTKVAVSVCLRCLGGSLS